jgi:hypothetical protein
MQGQEADESTETMFTFALAMGGRTGFGRDKGSRVAPGRFWLVSGQQMSPPERREFMGSCEWSVVGGARVRGTPPDRSVIPDGGLHPPSEETGRPVLQRRSGVLPALEPSPFAEQWATMGERGCSGSRKRLRATENRGADRNAVRRKPRE